MNNIKQAFSAKLQDGLKRAYGGRLPAISTVARDFALKAPHLPHVSDETIRKWLRGSCLPHVSRMQILIDWLGPALREPFEKPVLALQLSSQQHSHSIHKKGNGHNDGAKTDNDDHTMHDELVAVIDQLSEKECQSILAIAKLLADR